jgi:hypothetical protein
MGGIMEQGGGKHKGVLGAERGSPKGSDGIENGREGVHEGAWKDGGRTSPYAPDEGFRGVTRYMILEA